ncbi:MAG: DNA repair protein RecO [Planctomycetes bacterium]|nr:DNA repair protein RecO [Planctomycetota bacterium]MBI3835091.1 DNA repair protein RecO [Planctomycetota bacterium]
MPLSIRDDAIVLTRLDYSETSQILVLFTKEHGKVRAIAKGIQRSTKKQFAVGADLLDIGQVVLSAKHEGAESLATLVEWKQSRGLSGLRDSLSRLNAALYSAEITSMLTMDWDRHEGLFDALASTIVTVSECDDPLPPLIRYQLSVLDMVGSLPRFEACVSCGRTVELKYFSSFEGGMICRHCEQNFAEKRAVTAQTLETLQRADMSANDVAAISVANHPSTVAVAAGPAALLNYHISHLAGREPRLASQIFIRQRIG